MHRHVARVAVGVTMGLIAAALPSVPASAQEEHTIRGEVLDPATYLKDGRHGSELANQTYESLDGGQSLALLDEQNGALYLLLAEEPGEDPNELVYDYVNQTLNVKGMVYERNGLRGIVVKSVEPVEASSAPANAPGTAPGP